MLSFPLSFGALYKIIGGRLAIQNLLTLLVSEKVPSIGSIPVRKRGRCLHLVGVRCGLVWWCLYACHLVAGEEALLPPGWWCETGLGPGDRGKCYPAEGYHFEERSGWELSISPRLYHSDHPLKRFVFRAKIGLKLTTRASCGQAFIFRPSYDRARLVGLAVATRRASNAGRRGTGGRSCRKQISSGNTPKGDALACDANPPKDKHDLLELAGTWTQAALQSRSRPLGEVSAA
jgi:hypothetical protein